MEIKKRLMEIKKRLIRTMLCAMALAATAQAQVHKTIVLRDGWTFSKDGGTFNAVTLPHDWAISGKFDKNNDVWRSESLTNQEEIQVRCRRQEKGSIVPNLRWRVPILMPNYSLTVQWQSRKFT